MAGQYKVGSIQAPASIGSVGYTGIGFPPTCVIFFTAGSQTSPGFRDGARWMVGWQSAVGTAPELADGNISNDNAATTACRRVASARAIQYNSSGNVIIFRAQCTSLDADGFTLDWTEVTDGQSYVNYIAFGGDVDTFSDSANFAAGTGNQSITGVGFQPTGVLLLAHFSGAFYNSAMGWTDGTNQGAWDGESESAQAASDTWRLLLNDRVFAISGNGTINRDISIVSLDPDGFTVNCAATAGAIGLAYICFSGVSIKVGNFLQATTPSVQSVSGFGFSPGAVMFGSVGQTAQTTVQTENKFTLGVTDGSSHAVSSVHDTDTSDPTVSVGYHNAGAALAAITANATAASSTTEALATAALASDGVSLTWSAADATQRQWTYMAFEGEPIAAGGEQSHVFVD